MSLLAGAQIGLGVLGFLDSKKTNNQNSAATAEALAAAEEEINNGAQIALDMLYQGQAEAAAAIMMGAEEASAHILNYYGVAENVQREFYQEAAAKLQPFADLGLNAFDEMASMLGIKNSGGEIVPFDLRNLEETPGYQFQQGEGQKAVERSQAGRNLSGRASKELLEYGQQVASSYFNTRLSQLGALGSVGANAASQQASLAASTGANLAQTATSTGNNLANIAMTEAEGIANIGLATSNNAIQLENNRSNNLVDLNLAGTQAQNTARTNDSNNFQNLLEGVGTVLPAFGDKTPVSTRTSASGWKNPNLFDDYGFEDRRAGY